MKAWPFNVRVEWAVAAFCAWRASDLLLAWRHSPFDRLGWLAFILWLTPLLIAVFRSESNAGAERIPRPAVWLTWLVLAISLLSVMLDIHLLGHLALAGAVWLLLPTFPNRLIWLGLSLCWMPLLGSLAQNATPSGVLGLRIALAALAVFLGFKSTRAITKVTLNER
ncbi:MAG: hypothetical protein WCO56_14265 [Verrucomicrobiota bacterium]